MIFSVFKKQPAKPSEGLAAFQMFNSHLQNAVMVSPTKKKMGGDGEANHSTEWLAAKRYIEVYTEM